MRIAMLTSIVLLACNARANDQTPAKAKDYDLTAKLEPAALSPGGSAKLVVTIIPKGNYVMKTETPFKAVLTSAADVKLAKSEFTAKDFDDPKAPAKSISTSVTAAAAGQRQVSADLTFFLCTEQICQRFTDKTALTLDVK